MPAPDYSTLRRKTLDTLLRKIPDYPSWRSEKTLAFHAAQDDVSRGIKNGIWAETLSEICGIEPARLIAATEWQAEEKLSDILKNQDEEISFTIRLILNGIGDPPFKLDEYLGPEKTLLDFPTFRAWDEYFHNLQEGYWLDDNPTYLKRPYRGRTDGDWGSGVVDNRFAHLIIWTLAGYVVWKLGNAASDFIYVNVPHEWVSYPDDGPETPDGILWSFRVDAGGREAAYDALCKAEYQYINARYDALSEELFLKSPGQTWLLPRTDDPSWGQPCFDAIFSDPTAMENVRWTSFVEDMRAHSGDTAEVETLVQREVAALEAHLQAILDAVNGSSS